MADFTVTLPSLGDDAGDSAKVSFTYVDAGDEIAEGDDLLEMVTDKATFNVPCPKNGTVKEVLVEEDDEVKVGQAIAILEIED
ncbi:MAG: lipoyl domain-containing protein [Planctomycetes bacterium]|nr:lipoyl domain-containing protein [Planctomycetota bacterium]